MVDFARLQSIVKNRLQQDRSIRIVSASGDSLEEAVTEASVLLNSSVRKIDYEVVERGNSGFLGQGKRKWTIKAYDRVVIKKEELEGFAGDEAESAKAQVVPDVDGEVILRLSTDGALLKVISHKGNGRKANEAEAFRKLENRYVQDFDRALVSRVVEEASGEYVRVGSFEHRLTQDSKVLAEISDDEMKAYIVVSPPGVGGCDLSFETYVSYLRNNRIVFGIREDFLKDFVDKPTYKIKVLVAEGLKPENGKNAYIQYNFEVDRKKVKLKEEIDGRVDFKEVSTIENVVANQPLAKKMPPEPGVLGRTVTGKFIPAKDGNDIPLPLGKNVHVGDDKVTILADLNGQVMLSGGNINVEPIHVVNGDVGVKTGNITLLGTVIVNGNVEVGFSIKASGDIMVKGSVDKAVLDAEGDVEVHHGITGNSYVHAGKTVRAKFIEISRVEAGDMVIVSDGIINSQVDANKKIICQGKRASIVGGRIRATDEINAKVLGSPTSGTETICEVGGDPQSKIRLEALHAKKTDLEKQHAEMDLNIQTLNNIRKQRKVLPEDKEAAYIELIEKIGVIKVELMKTNDELVKIQEYLNSLKANSKVSASTKVYPGVKVVIRDAMLAVKSDYKAVTFILEDGMIRISKYEEPVDDIKKLKDGKDGKEGYSTNYGYSTH